MFPNLIGQAKVRNMSNESMGKLLGVARTTYEAKLKNGTFTCNEIKLLLKYFGKEFEYLFYTEEE